MFHSLRRALRIATGSRYIDVVEESPDHLVLRALGCTTSLNKTSGQLIQNGKRPVSMSVIKDVHLSQPSNPDGPPNWCVAIRLQGGYRIEVGSVTDTTDASLVASKLSSLVGKPVRLK